MSNPLLMKFAEELKQSRLNKNLSIDQIYSKTRIDRKYLQAIEEGNFSVMPDVYIRAFIKEYSKTVGLDSGEILSKFESAQKGIEFGEEKTEKDEVKSKDSTNKIIPSEPVLDDKRATAHDRGNRKPNKIFYYGLVAFLMLLFIFVIYSLFLNEPNKEIITERPFEEIVQQKEQEESSDHIISEKDNKLNTAINDIPPKGVDKIQASSEEPTISDVTSNNNKSLLSTGGDLQLSIIGTESSWIRVVSDEKDNMEFVINEGVTKILTADEKFYLHIGNSGGIKLLLNNNDLNFTGSPGKVRKIFVTKSGIEYLRRTPTFNAQ